jgi:hypothetical protein
MAGGPAQHRPAGFPRARAGLAGAGWRVERPETLSVRAQAEAFAKADVIAGFAGSTFHAALLVLLDRPSVRRAYYENIAISRGLRQT